VGRKSLGKREGKNAERGSGPAGFFGRKVSEGSTSVKGIKCQGGGYEAFLVRVRVRPNEARYSKTPVNRVKWAYMFR